VPTCLDSGHPPAACRESPADRVVGLHVSAIGADQEVFIICLLLLADYRELKLMPSSISLQNRGSFPGLLFCIWCCYSPLVCYFLVDSIMSQPFVVVIPLKLDGPNYREWAFSIKTVLRGYGLADHLTDNPLMIPRMALVHK
jgi:hypothetical protein